MRASGRASGQVSVRVRSRRLPLSPRIVPRFLAFARAGIYKLFSDLRRSTQFLMVSRGALRLAEQGAHEQACARVRASTPRTRPLPMTMKSVFQLTELRSLMQIMLMYLRLEGAPR